MFEHRPIEARYAALSAEFASFLDDIVEFDASGEWQHDGATSMSAWLAGRFGMARSTAREMVRVARALQELPAIKSAASRGELSFDQLKALTRFVKPEDDEIWAVRGSKLSPCELWSEVRRRQRRERQEAEIDGKLRYLWKSWDEDRRMLHIEADIPGEQGVAVDQALERAAQDIVLEEGPDILDPEGARLADALVELVSSGSKGAAKPIVVVHADAGVLAGTHGSLAETDSGVSLSHETVRRMSCDAVVEWLVVAGGRPIGIGGRSQKVPAWLRKHVVFRDRGCRFPGCGRTRWTDAHHIRHWANGGPTDLENLVQLCHTHHNLVHERGWIISGHPSGRLRFHDPTGREAFARPRAGPAAA